jgi:hypothetical protein
MTISMLQHNGLHWQERMAPESSLSNL